MDKQSPGSHLSSLWWQEPDLCQGLLASSLGPHVYAEHGTEQLLLNSVCVPRGAVPSHTSLGEVVVNYFSFKASIFFNI